MILSCLLYLLIYIVITIWCYSLYNQELIQKYSNNLYIPKHLINNHLKQIANATRLDLIELNIDENTIHEDVKPTVKLAPNNKKNTIIGILFSISISSSIGLIILMMCELGDHFNVDSRLLMFKFTIDILMFLLAIVIPYFIITILLNQDLIPRKSYQIGSTIGLFILWSYILHKCGDLTQDYNPRGQTSRNLIERKINEVSIVGITILAILSGIGSATTPYKTLPIEHYINKSKPETKVGEHDINSAIQYYNNTTLLLEKRQQELTKLQFATGGTIYNLPSANNSGNLAPKRGILHKVQSFANLSVANTQEEEMETEIKSLTKLRDSLYNDLLKLLKKFQQQSQNKSTLDLILIYGNYFLTGYCIYRILNVFFIKLPLLYFTKEKIVESAVVEPEEAPSSKDALAITLSKLILSIISVPMSEAQLVNQLSFILSGSLFICSFSNVLRTFQSFNKFFNPDSEFTKNWLKHLFIAELLGVYVIATALLIRTNLPTNLSNQISKILSLSGSSNGRTTSVEEVVFIDNWFDKIFALSCIITILVIVIEKFLESESYSYDEESFIEGSEYKLA
ncbi:unnamed protein product [Candida verbasci]|uniref:Abscisic acid G-protein coupled receptor-like domain-containing protein n=1 Tax=Candida verbasci TaxID=1227364 RepID=A0A9W4TUG6_9ASCO|nr:unnamed protein product [Candida verbasci]